MMTSNPGRLTWQPLTLHLRNPFRLSYGVTESRRSHWLRLADDAGWGEAAIPPYYGISDEAMVAFWAQAAVRQDPFPEDPAAIAAWVGDGPAPARAAVDLALHDRLARRRGVPLHRLLGLPAPPPLPTSFTIAIAAPDEMARLAAEAARYPILKLKLGSDDDAARLAAVRAARPDASLRVDANAGWSAAEAVARLRQIERYDLEMVEQPVAKHDIAGMGYVQARTDLPIVADESVQGMADLEALAEAGVRGINLKLMKVGGLAPGVNMLRRARELGLKVMLGCMIETSLGTTAAAHLAGLADWLDLDAPLLIADDPFAGLTYGEGARVSVPEGAGIGAVLRRGDTETRGYGNTAME
jgi:L-alanine-DL-glutamate epimerase-like enolase superfamily enzyme